MNSICTYISIPILCFSITAQSMEEQKDNNISFSNNLSQIAPTKKQKVEKDQLITLISAEGTKIELKKSIASLSPTIQKLIIPQSSQKEINFNELTAVQLKTVKTLLETFVDHYGYATVKNHLETAKAAAKKQTIMNAPTILYYLSIYKNIVTSDLSNAFNSLDLPLFTYVAEAQDMESEMNIPFALAALPTFGKIVTEYLVDDNFKEIQNYILNNSYLSSEKDNYGDLLSPDKKYYLKIDETEVNIIEKETNTSFFLFNKLAKETIFQNIWSPNSRYIAIHYGEGKIGQTTYTFYIWDVVEKKQVMMEYIPEKTNPKFTFIWSPNSQYIFLDEAIPSNNISSNFSFLDNYIPPRIVDITAKINRPLPHSTYKLTWSPNSKYIMTQNDEEINVYSFPEMGLKYSLKHKSQVRSLFFWAPNSMRFAFIGEYPTPVMLYSLRRNKSGSLPKHPTEEFFIDDLVWNHTNPDFLITINRDTFDACLRTYNILTGTWGAKCPFSGHIISIDNYFIIFTNTTEHSNSDESLIKVFDLSTSQLIKKFTIPIKINHAALVFENNFPQIKLTDSLNKVHFMNLSNMKIIEKLETYFESKILTQEIILLNAIQAARAKGQLYEMGNESQRIFNEIAKKDPEVGDAIRKILLPLIVSK